MRETGFAMLTTSRNLRVKRVTGNIVGGDETRELRVNDSESD